jgi:hypothetical protein
MLLIAARKLGEGQDGVDFGEEETPSWDEVWIRSLREKNMKPHGSDSIR